MILNVESVLMDRGFPEFHVKKELYWPKARPPVAAPSAAGSPSAPATPNAPATPSPARPTRTG
jgi:hypothetical protein